MAAVLSVRGLSVSMQGADGPIPVLENLSFEVAQGKTMALVGESGCGKSMTALAIMRLLPEDFTVTAGSVLLEGEDVLSASPGQLRNLRGNRMSMIFQEPMTALNPLFTVGDQIAEVLRRHRGLGRGESTRLVLELLKAVQIPAADRRIQAYPHQLSGGMRQRVMIAMALACRPRLLIADEPTTALDVTVQAQIFDLLGRLQDDTDTAIVLITHDLGAVAELADDVAVLYAGRCIEQGSSREVIAHARHPYTRGLMACVPHLRLGPQTDAAAAPLDEIPGMVPPLGSRGIECAFLPRCGFATDVCRSRPQPPLDLVAEAAVACWRHSEITP
jgi:peptide/nickel transport system ATP-binding protein